MTSKPTRDRTTRRAPARTVLVVLSALGLAATSAQATFADMGTQELVTRCVGIAPPVTVPNKLVVPAGQTCQLDGTTIQGDVDVRAGGNLIVEEGAEIQGALIARADSYVEIKDATVQGDSRLRGAFGAYADGATLGVVDVRNSGFFFADGSAVGDYLSRNSETSLTSVWVEGNLDARGDTMSDLDDAVVTGGLTVLNAEQGSMICNSEIDGSALLRNNGGVVQIGGQAPRADCGTNVIGGDVTLQNNAATEGTQVSSAIIRGDLTCTGNEPAPTGEGNRIRGQATGQCSDLPGPAARLGASSETSRTTQTEAKAEQRSEQARQQAQLTGAADIG